MKKTFTGFLVALSLMSVTAFVSSCSDYDDDIDNINNRLDQIEGKHLATLEEQVSSMELTLKSLNQADDEINNKIQQLTADQGAKIEALESAKADLEKKIKAIEERLSEIDDWMKACEASYATITDLGELEAKLNANDQLVESNLSKLIAEAKTEAIKAAGEAFEEAYRSKMDAVCAMWKSGTVSSEDPTVQALFNFMQQYDQQVSEIINETLKNQGIVTDEGYKNLMNSVNNLKEYVLALENRIFDLENRIQSLTFVPTKMLNSVLYRGITLKGDDWYKWDDLDGNEHMEYIKNEANGLHRATLKYKVSPAAMAAKFTTENVSFTVNRVTRANGDMPVFKAEKVEPIMENGKYTGEILIEATTDYMFTLNEKYNDWASSKPQIAYSMALQVNIENSNNTEDKKYTGIEFTSDYIIVNWSDGNNVMNSVWLVEGLKDGTWGTSLNENYHYKKLYSDTSERSFYGNWAFMKVDKSDPAGNKYTPISEVYPRIKITMEPIDMSGNLITDSSNPDIQPVTELVKPDNTEAYLLNPRSMQIKEGKNTNALVGDKIISTHFGVFISIYDDSGKLMHKSRIWDKQAFQETVEIVDAL